MRGECSAGVRAYVDGCTAGVTLTAVEFVPSSPGSLSPPLVRAKMIEEMPVITNWGMTMNMLWMPCTDMYQHGRETCTVLDVPE